MTRGRELEWQRLNLDRLTVQIPRNMALEEHQIEKRTRRIERRNSHGGSILKHKSSGVPVVEIAPKKRSRAKSCHDVRSNGFNLDYDDEDGAGPSGVKSDTVPTRHVVESDDSNDDGAMVERSCAKNVYGTVPVRPRRIVAYSDDSDDDAKMVEPSTNRNVPDLIPIRKSQPSQPFTASNDGPRRMSLPSLSNILGQKQIDEKSKGKFGLNLPKYSIFIWLDR